MQMASMHGRVLRVDSKNNRVIDIYARHEGMYILQIYLVGGSQINKRVLILR
jgi:hypothetical protein